MNGIECLTPAPGVDLAQCVARFGRPSGFPGLEKDPADLDRYAHIIERSRPDVVIECGTRTGASAAWFAHYGLRVITVDIESDRYDAQDNDKIIRIIGSSLHPTTISLVTTALAVNKDWRVMVSLDSDHSRAHVIREIAVYADLVSRECYLVVEDGIFHFTRQDRYDGDPLEAISVTLPFYPGFVRDVSVEGMYPITGMPAGFWRREVIS